MRRPPSVQFTTKRNLGNLVANKYPEFLNSGSWRNMLNEGSAQSMAWKHTHPANRRRLINNYFKDLSYSPKKAPKPAPNIPAHISNRDKYILSQIRRYKMYPS